MTKYFLALAIGLCSFSAFAGFTDETCKVKSMYNGEKFDSKYKGTFGLIQYREKFRIVFHTSSPTETFYYDEGPTGEMDQDTFGAFMEDWCPLMFSKKKCAQIKKVEIVDGEKSEGLGFMHFLDEKNQVIARAAGIDGMIGICR